MRIISDKTKKEYATVEECVQAEKEFDEKVAEKKAAEEKALAVRKEKAEKLATERKEAAAKVDEKRKAMMEAKKAYFDEVAKFNKNFGPYHYSFVVKDEWPSLWDEFFNSFWF